MTFIHLLWQLRWTCWLLFLLWIMCHTCLSASVTAGAYASAYAMGGAYKLLSEMTAANDKVKAACLFAAFELFWPAPRFSSTAPTPLMSKRLASTPITSCTLLVRATAVAFMAWSRPRKNLSGDGDGDGLDLCSSTPSFVVVVFYYSLITSRPKNLWRHIILSLLQTTFTGKKIIIKYGTCSVLIQV